MPPFYGHSITRVFLDSGFIAKFAAGCSRKGELILIFLLVMKHGYSIAIQKSVNDLGYLKELCINACYSYGSGICRNMTIIPELHLGHRRLSFPVITR